MDRAVAPGLAQLWYHSEFTPALLQLGAVLRVCSLPAGLGVQELPRAGQGMGTNVPCLFLPFSGKHPCAYIPLELAASQQSIYLPWLTPFSSRANIPCWPRPGELLGAQGSELSFP